jgi:methylmalonyl-CoA/ethylmalonyl-CoA epimerase
MSVHAKGLDHVAIVVRDLEESIRLWRDALGLELEAVEEVPEQEVRTAIFGKGLGRVELISPTTADSGVAKFLEKRGEGLHHVCIEVEDIEAAMASLRKAGAPLIDAEPRPGAGGARVAFVHPKGMRGVLTELRQGPPGENARPGETPEGRPGRARR